MHLWDWDKPRRYMPEDCRDSVYLKKWPAELLVYFGTSDRMTRSQLDFTFTFPAALYAYDMTVRHSGLQKEVLALYRRYVILGLGLPQCLVI
jgi:hypothetical protein